MARKNNSELSDEASSMHNSSQEVLTFRGREVAGPPKGVPRFESLPPEIRNMIYGFLLPPAELEETFRHCFQRFEAEWKPWYHKSYIYFANTTILRTNRNIYREASFVLYHDTLLVSIEWNTCDHSYLRQHKIPGEVAFKFVPPGAPLPPCVVGI